MLKDTLRSIKSAHISLIFVGLMWVLPFLYHDHPLPIPTFYAEWIAAILGLCAMAPLFSRQFWQSLNIPRMALLPIALAILIMVQYAIGKGSYLEQSLLSALYLLWASLLIILGRHLREKIGLPALATALALFLLMGAEISALIGILQHYSINTFFGVTVVMAKNFPEATGNLAQPNSLANYLTLGLVSLGLLHVRWRLRIWQVLLLAMPLLLVLALTGSRSSWLYLSGIAGMAFLWRHRGNLGLPLLKYSLLLLLGFGLMHWVSQTPWLDGTFGNVTAGQRLVAATGTSAEVRDAIAGADNTVAEGWGSIRLSIWREAWLMFSRNPLMGVGFNQFEWQHFQLGPELRDSTLSNINEYVEHAHNLVLHLAAETGLSGLIILFGMLALWLAQTYRAPRTEFHWWGYAVLLVLAIHSMLEYPLWYAFFLGLTAVILGMFDDPPCYLVCRGRAVAAGRWAMLAVLFGGALILSQTFFDYRDLVRLHAAVTARSADGRGAGFRLVRDELLGMSNRPTLLRPYIEKTILDRVELEPMGNDRFINERAMRFAPDSEAVYREVLLLMRDGWYAQARVQMEKVIWAYPKDIPGMLMQLEQLAQTDEDAGRFPALLDFARDKYEEWQRINHG